MKKAAIILIILVLLASNAFIGIKYYFTEVLLSKVLSASSINTSVLDFNKLFVEKVLKAQGEVSVEDRLRLENAATGTKDSVIIDSWHNFLASTTEEEAQSRVLELLSMFPDKIINN